MSEELLALERRASAKRITDPAHIDRVMEYMLALPLSCFHRKECMSMYRYFQNDLCRGFDLNRDGLESLALADILLLIGYAPGKQFFSPPDKQARRLSRAFNTSGLNYALAHLITAKARTDIRVKEFLHIGVNAFADYLRNRVEDACTNGLLTSSERSEIAGNVEAFRLNARELQAGNTLTLGDVMSRAIAGCEKTWMCFAVPLDEFCTKVLKSYELLIGLFMDCIRMPLVPSGRERFLELLTRYGARPSAAHAYFEPEACYEPGSNIT